MTLKDLLRKKDKIRDEARHEQAPATIVAVPEFKFIRTTTDFEETIQPPTYPGDEQPQQQDPNAVEVRERRHHLGFRKPSSSSITKDLSAASAPPDSSEKSIGQQQQQQLPVRPKTQRKLSHKLHLHHDRSRSTSAESSTILPDDLPEAPVAVALPASGDGGTAEEAKEVKEHREAQWEKRATILAQNNPLLLNDNPPNSHEQEKAHPRSPSPNGAVSNAHGDENIQEAIRLHEAGSLEPSTAMFGRLADPNGANNALAQVLYGLALRHGWGITPEPEKAVHYLSLAASNSASIEEQALASGMKRGGAAKGELVLAIFELANCFRHGWGVKRDALAARQYYETAANLGDTDAMEEAAWCYMEGFGGGKDKVRRSSFLTMSGDVSMGTSYMYLHTCRDKMSMSMSTTICRGLHSCQPPSISGINFDTLHVVAHATEAESTCSQFKAAQYLRLAEEKGHKGVGQSWYVFSPKTTLVATMRVESCSLRAQRVL